MTPGLLIGCHIDTSTGLVSFTVNGQEAANKFQVHSHIIYPAGTALASRRCLCLYIKGGKVPVRTSVITVGVTCSVAIDVTMRMTS